MSKTAARANRPLSGIKLLLASWLIALVLTLLSSMIAGQVLESYPDIDSCQNLCQVQAAGWPWPYLVDYPGLSPAGSVSLTGALLGMDHVRPGAFFASFAFWHLPAVGSVMGVWYLRRRPAKAR